jgi:hypothetical protein
MGIFRSRWATPLICTLLTYGLLVFAVSAARATPPTPPAELLLPDAEALAALRPENGAFTISARVRAHQEISKPRLAVRIIRTGTLGQPQGQVRRFDFNYPTAGETQPVEVEIPARAAAGIYRIEVALHAEQEGKTATVDEGVLYQVVEQGRPRLTTPIELRRHQVGRHEQAFQEALSQHPEQPDIRLLADPIIPVPADLKKYIRQSVRPIQTRADGSRPKLIEPYLRRGTGGGQSDAPKLAVGPAPLRLLGQVVFEDWYTDTLGNPVFSPLANATITVIVDAPLGYDLLVDDTVTDENGSWSLDVDPSLQGADLYYTVNLGNQSLDVLDDLGNDYVWWSATRSGTATVDFGQQVLTTNIEAAAVFATINIGWNHIVEVGGQDPGQIEARFPAVYTHWNSDPALGAIAVYVEMGHEDIPDVILHEYGHALMHYAFYERDISPGGPHTWNEPMQDRGLAYSEGWAHAFAMSVCPDGQFTEDEGNDEGPGEWPECTATYSIDTGVTVERFQLAANRMGERNEGRVAAALNDFLDAPNDDNLDQGTPNDDIGRTGYQDDNVSDRIALATIYRDHMWNFLRTDFVEFFASLLGDLNGTPQSRTVDILFYSWMPIATAPVICVASKVAVAMSSDYAATLDGLRSFRDEVLEPLTVGRRWIQSYYSNSPELAVLLIGSSKARQAAQVIVEHFSEIGRVLKEPKGLERLSDSEEPALPRRVTESIATITRLIEAKGSLELKRDLSEARRFLKTFEGKTVSQAVRQVAAMEKVGSGQRLPVIRPTKFAPGSQNVDWELIKKNLPPDAAPQEHE